MKRYIDWNEYTTIFPRETGFACDNYSRVIAQQLVEDFFKCTCTRFTIGRNSADFDMFSNLTGKTYVCEIKDRWNFASTDYNDHIFEDVKYTSLQAKAAKGEGEHISLFTIYKDGVIKITNKVDENIIDIRGTWAPKTTALNDHTPVPKNFVHIKPNMMLHFCILYDTDRLSTLDFQPIFSFDPIDVKKLNERLEKLNEIYQLF